MKAERFPRLQGFVGFGTLSVVLISALALGANRPVSWSLLAIGITLFFAGQVLLASFQPRPLAAQKAIVPGVLFAIAVMWGWIQSSLGAPIYLVHPVWMMVPDVPGAISADPGQGRHAVMRLLCYAMVFVVTLWTCVKRKRAGTVLKAIALFSSGLAIYGLYTFTVGVNPIVDEVTGENVMRASFVNRNSYATYAGFGALANIAAYIYMADQAEGERLARKLEGFFSGAWIYALGALLCIGAVTLTQSRAGSGAGLVGLVVFVVAWNSGRRRWSPVLPMVLGVVIVLLGATSATGLLERLIATDATDARFVIYPAMFTAILDRPFLGHGLGAFHDTFRSYIPLEGAMGEWVRAHSTYLELAIGLGLPAAFVLLLAQGLLAWQIWRGTIRRQESRVFACFALGVIAIAAVHSLFDFSLQMPASAALFAVVLGLGFAQSFTREQIDAGKNRRSRRASSNPKRDFTG